MTPRPFVLVPGHWLGGWAWDRVAADLEAAGHPVAALTLPGLEEDPRPLGAVNFGDHVTALVAAVRTAGPGCVLVAHSGAGRIASGVLDRDPDCVARVVYVDSGPAAAGTAFDASVPAEAESVALPSFEQLAAGGASLEGISERDLQTFAERARPHPASVLREAAEFSNDRRHAVPTTLLACSLPAAQAQRWAREGVPMFAELAELSDLTTVDLPTGHWPMFSRPRELAAVLSGVAALTA